jgi:hypothetical protein
MQTPRHSERIDVILHQRKKKKRRKNIIIKRKGITSKRKKEFINLMLFSGIVSSMGTM